LEITRTDAPVPARWLMMLPQSNVGSEMPSSGTPRKLRYAFRLPERNGSLEFGGLRLLG
jgi:hypothetical protein